jgi:fructokinase
MLRAASGLRFFDVNLRNPWIVTERLHWSLDHADIVKANDAELELINQLLGLGGGTTEEQARLLMQRYSLRGVLVTGGAGDAWWVDNSTLIVTPSTVIADICDTVGAGDAFSSVFILGLLEGWALPLTLQRAHDFAGAICQIRGAVPEYKEFYDRFIDKWGRHG